MKRLLFVFLALIVSVTLFAGGGGQQAPAGGGAAAPAAAPAQPKEIRVLLANQPYGELLKPLLPEFEKENNIRIIIPSIIFGLRMYVF